ncbi:iron ABC transporter permease (plasmid) [Paracoccus albus]|nr:iron ABC transporter permease [Paracoccus albus]WBU62190.1 iron ABC transporter permease [Paracoccus albus]
MAASLAVGSRHIPLPVILDALRQPDPRNDLHLIVRELRVPRTLLAALAGAALGMAGAMMQALTRNPLAEPGLLGINAGAAMAVVLGIALFELSDIAGYVWFGFAGAGLAGAVVVLLGRAHDTGSDPIRLVLAGAGLSVVLGALTGILVLNAPLELFDALRKWTAGSMEGRGLDVAAVLAPAVLAGGLLAAGLAGNLNAIALGQDLGRTLGVRTGRVWVLSCLTVMLLAGAATAAVGPVGFVGLLAPHAARIICGPDHRLILPASGLIAAFLLLTADIMGRVLARPEEIAAGIVAAILGGPFFIILVRRFRLVGS